MSEEEKKKQEEQDAEKDFFADLLDEEDFVDEDQNEDPDDENKKDGEGDPESETDSETKDGEKDLTEEEQRRKNKDAEEARKRREAEEKAKKEEEEKKKLEESKKSESDKKEAERTNKLGEQLVQFRNKYPDVDLGELDKDKSFKTFIDGKLLGKKDFTSLYEDYMNVRGELSGKSSEEIRQIHRKKQQASSGSSVGTTQQQSQTPDVYSEAELDKISQRLPLMSHDEAERVMEKFDRSIDFYKNEKN